MLLTPDRQKPLPAGHYRLDRPAHRSPDPSKHEQPESGQDETLAPRRVLLCAQCGNPVSDDRFAIAVAGDHQHTFVNPHGIVYNIRCFAQAYGVSVSGDPSADWSWFPGYSWQVEDCAACGAHLGWLFRSAGDAFHGLIADRIVEVEEKR